MRLRLGAAAILGAGALAAGACGSAAPSRVEGRPCEGLTPPRILMANPLDLPTTFTSAHLSAELPAEVTVGPDGAAREPAVRTTDFSVLAPFAEETLKRARFSGGALEGNPAAVRLPVRVAVGNPRPRDPARAPADVWAFVAAGQSREARWQLRDSVSRITVVAHVPALAQPGAIVAVAPGGQTRTLIALPVSDAPAELRRTVEAGKAFAGTGVYTVELRRGETALASSRFTVADEYRAAVINACDTVLVTKKTGPGN